MKVTRRQFVTTGTVGLATMLAGCSSGTDEATSEVTTSGEVTASETVEPTSNLTLDMGAWSYNADDDVYYQIGIAYCETPADADYENLAVFVPGPYFTATDNGDGTFTCEKNDSGAVGSFTAATAPIVLPVETPGYSAMAPLSEYSSLTTFTGEGLVYVHAGCRGREHGAPAGVCDLKAAVRFIRFFADVLPGSIDRIFTFGMSGGGAQSALMGATGDSDLYAPYLTAIGAVQGVSDAIYGSMDWCPITGLDVADAAYEWMMGCTRSSLTDEEQQISDGLAEAFATYLNDAGICDADGAALTLDESVEGIYQAGSYYECVRAAIEESLNNFLQDTAFPYDADASSGMGGPGGGFAGHGMRGARPEGMKDGEMPEDMRGAGPGAADGAEGAGPGGDPVQGMEQSYEEMDGISRGETSGGVSISGTFETASAYIQALNADANWVAYDEATNTATVSSVADFCVALKQASKGLGAFDALDRSQGENTLFGIDGNAAHFDVTLKDILVDLGVSTAADYEADLALTDSQGTEMATRVKMYTPLYYLLPSAEGYGTSEPARHWRIRSGINQGDTALTTELNLSLALANDARVDSVDFAAVWGMGHTKAERTGDSDTNFVEWVKSVS